MLLKDLQAGAVGLGWSVLDHVGPNKPEHLLDITLLQRHNLLARLFARQHGFAKVFIDGVVNVDEPVPHDHDGSVAGEGALDELQDVVVAALAARERGGQAVEKALVRLVQCGDVLLDESMQDAPGDGAPLVRVHVTVTRQKNGILYWLTRDQYGPSKLSVFCCKFRTSVFNSFTSSEGYICV